MTMDKWMETTGGSGVRGVYTSYRNLKKQRKIEFIYKL